MRILLAATCLALIGCGGSGGSEGSSSPVGSSSSHSAQSSVGSASQVSSSVSSGSSDSAASSSVGSQSSDPQVSGLDARPSNNTCLAGESPSAEYGVALERAYPDLSFSQPVEMRMTPADSRVWYLAEKSGRIFRFANSPGANSRDLFVDLRSQVNDSANEAGLLSFAFHPNFASNGEVYVFYQTDEPGGGCCDSLLSRFTTDGSGQLKPDSEQVLIRFTAPYVSKNHFGGRVGFGRDGLLYLSIGDGGSAGDPDNRAQNTANLWGSMIRIDVGSGTPYSIPSDNPFAAQSGFLCDNDSQMQQKQSAGGDCPELYAWGLRNPWRWSFDRATDDIWLADVGQGNWEEVNIIQRGGNYGWRIREGAHCYNPSSGCQSAGLIDPVAEEPQPEFRSITGGYRYRGSNIESLAGHYVYGDFATGSLHALSENDSGGWDTEVLIESTGQNIASFAQDPNGELYILSFGGGIYRLVESGGAGQVVNAPEPRLSDTGCVQSSNPRQPAEGLIPYKVNAPFWSDGAQKQRWIALPDGQGLTVGNRQDWSVPPGSVLMKHFYLNSELIETRLLKHHTDDVWAGYTYAWNDSGTDAHIVTGGAVMSRKGQDWIYPSASECMQCHTQAAGVSLGLETAQLNGDFTYPTTGRSGQQIATLKDINALSGTTTQAKLVDPSDQAAPISDRARAYLHTNCAQCHRPGGGTNVNMDLRWHIDFIDTELCNVPPQTGDMGINDAMRLLPGNSDLSVLLRRMALRDHAKQMPPVGSSEVDVEGERLLREWIDNLHSCSLGASAGL